MIKWGGAGAGAWNHRHRQEQDGEGGRQGERGITQRGCAKKMTLAGPEAVYSPTSLLEELQNCDSRERRGEAI